MRVFNADFYILIIQGVRTNELMRTFDLYYVTRSNLKKHACRSYYLSANYPSNNSSPKNVTCLDTACLNVCAVAQ